jgi:radical SAM protein with 4Fe4S-binding SPASM domain
MYFTSIDGLEKTNDEIRRKPGAFKRCFQALEFFKSIDVNPRIINTVVLPDNIEQLPELRKIIINSAATIWRLAIPNSVGRAKNNEKMSLNDDQVKYLFDFVEETRKEFVVEISEDAGYLGCLSMKLRSVPFFCEAGLTRCSIMPDGEVYGCQIAYDNGISEGNVRDKSFKEIWETGFSRFRDPQLDKEECHICEHLDSCRGGCWGMRLVDKHCYKRIWDAKC